jgi:voltage-gated potassium channel
MSAQRKLGLALVTFFGVFVVGTAGYVIIEQEQGATIADAAYMTAITLSTVGFTEVWELTPGGRIWTCVVILFGIGAVSVAFTSMISLIVSGELRSYRGRQKVESLLKQMEDHIVVCGYGRMGAMAVSELRQAGSSIVVIELNEDREDDLREQGIAYVLGDATDEDNLKRAGIERASALVAVLPHDVDNVFITLTVHTLRPDMTIIARAEQPRTELKLKRAGATRVVCPQVIGARVIGNMVLRPAVTDFVEVARKGVELEMDEYVLGANSPLVGKTLKETAIRVEAAATVVAIKRAGGGAIYNPQADLALQRGDTLILVGPSGTSKRLDRLSRQGPVAS